MKYASIAIIFCRSVDVVFNMVIFFSLLNDISNLKEWITLYGEHYYIMMRLFHQSNIIHIRYHRIEC